MEFEIRETEIELIPQSEHDRDVVAKLHGAFQIQVRSGRSTDPSWPPNPRKTNVVLVLPDPNDWGT